MEGTPLFNAIVSIGVMIMMFVILFKLLGAMMPKAIRRWIQKSFQFLHRSCFRGAKQIWNSPSPFVAVVGIPLAMMLGFIGLILLIPTESLRDGGK